MTTVVLLSFYRNFVMKLAKVLLPTALLSLSSLFSTLPANAGFWSSLGDALLQGGSSSSGSSSSNSSVYQSVDVTFRSNCQYPIKIAAYQNVNGTLQMKYWYTILPYNDISLNMATKENAVFAYYAKIAVYGASGGTTWSGNSRGATVIVDGVKVQPAFDYVEEGQVMTFTCPNVTFQSQPQYQPQFPQQQTPQPPQQQVPPAQQQTPAVPPLIQTY
jgi:hypothetical protein